MALRVITPPVCEPITVAQAKLHTRIDSTDEDALIPILVAAARAHGEQVTGRAFVERTVELTLDGFPGADGSIELPAPPLGEVLSVKYDDPAGLEQELLVTGYRIATVSDFVPPKLRPARGTVWPATEGGIETVRVRYKCGWPVSGLGTEASPYAAAVPEAIKAWLLVRVTGLYEQREAFVLGQNSGANGVVSMGPSFVDSLLDPYRLLEVV